MARAGRSRRRGGRGFTLVEIMVVVVIVGLLATLVGPRVFNALFKSNLGVARANVKNLADAVRLYMLDHQGQIPEGLEALINPDENGNTYLEDFTEVPRDPWGNEYVMEENPDRRGSFIIRSWGPDGQPETEDDITNLNLQGTTEGGGR